MAIHESGGTGPAEREDLKFSLCSLHRRGTHRSTGFPCSLDKWYCISDTDKRVWTSKDVSAPLPRSYLGLLGLTT